MKRILIVDDDALIAMTAATIIEDLGYEVLEAHSGADAMAIIESGEAIDLLMTDQSMPGMTGSELFLRVRALSPTLPVVIVTGYSELPEGFASDVALLSKPYSDEDLANQIRKSLSGNG